MTMLNGTFYIFFFSFFSIDRTQFLKENLVRHKIKKCGLSSTNVCQLLTSTIYYSSLHRREKHIPTQSKFYINAEETKSCKNSQ